MTSTHSPNSRCHGCLSFSFLLLHGFCFLMNWRKSQLLHTQKVSGPTSVFYKLGNQVKRREMLRSTWDQKRLGRTLFCPLPSLPHRWRTKSTCIEDFPGSPMVKNLPYNAGYVGLIPGWRTKIPRAEEQLSPCATTRELRCTESSCLLQLRRGKIPCDTTKILMQPSKYFLKNTFI